MTSWYLSHYLELTVACYTPYWFILAVVLYVHFCKKTNNCEMWYNERSHALWNALWPWIRHFIWISALLGYKILVLSWKRSFWTQKNPSFKEEGLQWIHLPDWLILKLSKVLCWWNEKTHVEKNQAHGPCNGMPTIKKTSVYSYVYSLLLELSEWQGSFPQIAIGRHDKVGCLNKKMAGSRSAKVFWIE